MSLLTDEIKVKTQELEFQAVQAVEKFPKKKKILLIFLLVSILPAYLLARFFSQSYWEKQYSGFLISAKPSFTTSLPITISSVEVVPTAPGNYSAYAYITNSNLELSAKNIIYEFSFYSPTGELVATDSDRFFLLPNEKKYLIAPRISTSSLISRASISFKELKWQKKTELSPIRLSAPQPKIYDQFDPPALTADGTITNNSPYDLSEVRLVFQLYDKSKKLLAVSQRKEFDLKKDERRAYKQLWPNLQTVRVASIEVSAETNILDDSNINVPAPNYLPSGNASDLSRPELKR